MKALGVFQVFRCNKIGAGYILDGRLLADICIMDKLFIIKNKDIKKSYCDSNKLEQIEVCDNAHLSDIDLKGIFSYGKQWDALQGGMTARIECLCDGMIEGNDMICKFNS